MQTKPPIRLVVKGCDTNGPGGECALATFVKLAGSNVPEDYDAECQLSPPTSTSSSAPVCDDSGKQAATSTVQNLAIGAPFHGFSFLVAAIVLGVTTGVLLLAFIITLILYCRLKKRKLTLQVILKNRHNGSLF